MSRNVKCLYPVDENERRELAQRLCLALRNVQVYGVDHSVSVTSIRAFYDSLVKLLDRFPEVEWSLAEGKVLLNGQPCELRTADDVLARRMQVCELETFALVDAVSRVELNRFITWLATGSDPLNGAEAFVGIRIEDSVYARISSRDYDPSASDGESEGKAAKGSEKADSGGGVKQFDLDSMLDDAAEPLAGAVTSGLDPFSVTQHVSGFLAQQRLAEEQQDQMLALLQRAAGDQQALKSVHDQFVMSGGREKDWVQLCWTAGVTVSGQVPPETQDRNVQVRRLQEEVEALRSRCAMGQLDASSVTEELDKIRGSLDGLMDTVHAQANTLVQKVDADRDHIARLEQQARDSGAPIHLSREELLASLAEINQELAQPLTVSSALLELLSSGRLGYVDEKQKELVKVATSSLDRLEVVVKYLQRLSGMPIELSPDRALLDEVYDQDRSR